MSIFVGRNQELSVLESVLADVERGAGHCALVSGEAGIGKSRLLAEIGRRAAGAGFVALEGRCFEQDRSFAYAPIIDMLRTFYVPQSPSEIVNQLGPLAPKFARLLSELTPYITGQQTEATLDPEAEKRLLFEVLAHWIWEQAGAQPLFVVLEDLQWSDDASLEFLLFLARRVAAYPILLLLSYRSPVLQPDLAEFLAALDRLLHARDIRLDPLTRQEVEAMMRSLLDLHEPIRPGFLDTIYDLTEGIPFFVEEVLSSVIAAGNIFQAEGRWEVKLLSQIKIPRNTNRLVRARLEQLSPAARQVADLAAVSGRSFDFSVLQALTGYSDQALLDAIKELVAAHLVVEESAERFSFRHALTREALYDRLLIRERRALHRQISVTLEEIYADALDAYLSDLAYHFYEAGQWAQALTYARRAGENAQRLYSARAAVQQFTRALDAAQYLKYASQWELHRLRAQAFDMMGDFEGARADYEAALEAARALPDQQAVWQLLIDLAQLWTERDDTRLGEYSRQALELARNLGEPTYVAQSLNWLGHWYLRSGQAVEAIQHHQEALSAFEALGNRRAIATTLNLLATASSWSGDHKQAVACYEKAVAIRRELDDRQELADSLIFMSVLTLKEEHLREAEELARTIGWRGGEAFALAQLGMTLTLLGRYGEAADTLQRGLDIAEKIGHLERRNNLHLGLGFLYLKLLAPVPAQSYLQNVVALASEMSSAFYAFTACGYLASAYLLEGKLDEAEALLASLPPVPEQWGPIWLVKRTAEIELALARQKVSQALHLADHLLQLAPAPAKVMGMIAYSYAVFLRVHGQALILAGQLEEAEATLHTARQMLVGQGVASELWWIDLCLRRLYQLTGRPQEAGTARAEARRLVQQLAKEIPGDKLRDNFRERALNMIDMERSMLPEQVAKATYGGLTRREREVAAQLVLGKTNREIAETLVVSTKTVEAHVSRILSRLGFTSRAQIAGWAVEKKLASALDSGRELG